MITESTYLTEEELAKLVADVEAHELVAAPPDMMEDILVKIQANVDCMDRQNTEFCPEVAEKAENDIRLQNRRNQKREFYQYCFRVIASAAAAILLVFTMPKLSETMLKLSDAVSEVPVVQETVITARYATKEEALNDRGIFADAFGNGNLFDNDFQWNFFK